MDVVSAIAGMGRWLAVPRHGWSLVAFIAGGALVGAGVLAMMCATPHRYRKTVVGVVTFLGGLIYAAEFLIPHKMPPENLAHIHKGSFHISDIGIMLTNWTPFLADSTMVIGSFTVLLGIGSLFQIHGKAVSRRKEGWYNSLAFFVGFFSILIAGFMQDYCKGAVKTVSSETFNILFMGFLASLNATMFSLIAFYIVSAAYRAFRIRSTEAALMMVAAALIMLALVPVGVILTSWLPDHGPLAVFRLERMGPWILAGPNMAAQRAISFGIAVGALAMSLRIWLSLERGSFFDRQL